MKRGQHWRTSAGRAVTEEVPNAARRRRSAECSSARQTVVERRRAPAVLGPTRPPSARRTGLGRTGSAGPGSAGTGLGGTGPRPDRVGPRRTRGVPGAEAARDTGMGKRASMSAQSRPDRDTSDAKDRAGQRGYGRPPGYLEAQRGRAERAKRPPPRGRSQLVREAGYWPGHSEVRNCRHSLAGRRRKPCGAMGGSRPGRPGSHRSKAKDDRWRADQRPAEAEGAGAVKDVRAPALGCARAADDHAGRRAGPALVVIRAGVIARCSSPAAGMASWHRADQHRAGQHRHAAARPCSKAQGARRGTDHRTLECCCTACRQPRPCKRAGRTSGRGSRRRQREEAGGVTTIAGHAA